MRYFVLLLVLAFFTISCEGPSGPMGPQGPQGPVGPGTNWFIKYYEINTNDWKRIGKVNEIGSFFESPTISIPQISDFVYKEGTVMVYFEKDGKYQTPLPYTIYNGKDKDLWSVMYDYEFSVGKLTVFSTISDFHTIDIPPTIYVKVVLLW